MIKNVHNCSLKLWRKMSTDERSQYNFLYEQFHWTDLYPPMMQNHVQFDNWRQTIAHNVAWSAVKYYSNLEKDK